ncbi:hypothetical protein EBBID32_39560 [Sphingobium indicum BiD32]|uniref:Uncharacterized protein n=1 Tax=Sphingobium indicum BiD32 TaxID=1301087 RepID=N1MVG3_9SPHN|nr:hypothetical protein EBBID32_39560 [Sphingobium indicum BiD32]
MLTRSPSLTIPRSYDAETGRDRPERLILPLASLPPGFHASDEFCRHLEAESINQQIVRVLLAIHDDPFDRNFCCRPVRRYRPASHWRGQVGGDYPRHSVEILLFQLGGQRPSITVA